MKRYVLDACALIAYLQKENGFDKVISILNAAEEGKATITINIINLFEVYYDICRTSSKERAELILVELAERPIVINSEISMDLFKEAGNYKLKYKMSLADSIALAQAAVLEAELLTSDHHEFNAVEKGESIRFHWIR